MDTLDPLFPLQVRAARALPAWTQQDLPNRAGVSELFVNRLERSERIAPAQKLGALRDVLLHVQIRCFSPDKEIGIAVEGVAASVLLLELKGKRTTRPKGVLGVGRL